jgi:hypothetical protein
MPLTDPFFHIYAAILIVLAGFAVIEIRRLRKSVERK